MNRIFLFLVFVMSLVGCAKTDTKPIFSSAPTYPKTSVQLTGNKSLTHQAGRPCTTHERPEVGVADRERTFSEWHLKGADGKTLVSAPSFLSDPRYAGELQDYYRKEDVVDVFESASGNTVVIVEDRSPTYPRRAYLLLTADSNGKWTYRELFLESYLPEQKSLSSSAPPDTRYPKILEVKDTYIRHTSANGNRRLAINSFR